ncbi:ABC transporter permease [Streptomyces antioxidans]|uniref:Transport permease protein n=1 Tax=Streptomyces antioxidans TaxID=1507734 RepID=A0A1V4DD12_9ACTN|nr:ABC transporter permease [Streptomyces antioxidans]OPF84594.1 ABC transporter permease [Streptomyces antioxidans]
MSIATERPNPPEADPAAAAGPPRERQRFSGSGPLRQIQVLSGRSLRALREPALVLPGVLEPILMLTVFSQVFRSVSQAQSFPAGVSYIDYLLPAFLITSAVSAGLKSGVALTTELNNGIISRFKSMPIHTGTILIGRSVADTVLNAVNMVVMLVAGALVFGFDPEGGILGSLGALLVAVVLGWSLGWVFMALSAWLRKPEAMQPVGGMVNMVLLFASNAFVPTDGLPSWLRAFAEVNPMSHAITAARSLALGEPRPGTVLMTLGICTVMVAVIAPLAIRNFRKAS